MAEQTLRDRLRVVLVETRNPLNIGAAARAMSNFGVMHLRVVRPFEASFREAQSAVGAAELLASAEEFTSVAEAVADCSLVIGTTAGRDRELQHPMHDLRQAASMVRESAGIVALLFGSEKRGLSNEDLSHCHWLMHIPTRAEHLSMNLGQAVAVCLWEFVREELDLTRADAAPHATAAEIERLATTLGEALEESGYWKGSGDAAAEEKVRRLVYRMALNAEDAELLLGMVRKMRWKMGREGSRG